MLNRTFDFLLDSLQSSKMKWRESSHRMMNYAKKSANMKSTIKSFTEMDKTSWKFLPKNLKDWTVLLRRKMERSELSVARFRITKNSLDFLLCKLTNSEENSENSKTDMVRHRKSQKPTNRGFKSFSEKTLLSMTKAEPLKKTLDFPLDSLPSFKPK